MDLVPILDYLQTNTDLRSGVDLFLFRMPSSVDNGVLITIEPDMGRVDHEIPGRYNSRFQVIVRNSDYVTGRALAMTLFDLLSIEHRHDFISYETQYIRPAHLPFDYRQSDGGKIEFSINFDTLIHRLD